MDINSLTNTVTGTFDDVLVRNPPYTGTFVSVTTLGGGGGSGGSYDDTALTNMINSNTLAIGSKANSVDVYLKTATYSRSETNTLLDAKHPSVTVQDSTGASKKPSCIQPPAYPPSYMQLDVYPSSQSGSSSETQPVP